MPVISVLGLASGTTRTIFCSEPELEENLLKWLRCKDVTIASSCDGEGVCKKCVIQNDWLTCKMTLRSFLKLQSDGHIEVSYL